MEWKEIEGAEEMTPLELNAVPLSSELHTPLQQDTPSADALPGASAGKGPVKKTSLSALSGLK